ncbi:AraC family transcriptional regulator [Chitinophaga sp. XS-30]|uniref:AraC family transcriptional regulator n=1 Tax=Chitinophaga sp. XS-30 TaxID=2604421 RepID=UPI0011DE0B16|nr:AraC family transcriptional regulator [Chitinophaga sp. XS-30]QEH41614.1 AraC family transcriptional regulator [Chitinophaga sp. XS-30]
MTTPLQKRRDGFEGQKLISLPNTVYRSIPQYHHIYITHIGYFPKAAYHYRERKKGCVDNILIYCLRGKGWYIIGDKQYHVGPNQFIHIPATTQYMRYGADDKDPWTIYWVHFSGEDMAAFNNMLRITEKDGPQNIAFNEKSIQIWENIYQSLEMGYSKDNLMNANLCLHYFLATFLYPDKHTEQAGNAAQDLVTESILFMRSRLGEKLTVEDLAMRHQLSHSHFSNLFRKATGMSPIDYFIQLKIQKACQLLYDASIKVKDVAMAIGYDDPYYFSRLFKKLMDMSPEQYRLLRKKQG